MSKAKGSHILNADVLGSARARLAKNLDNASATELTVGISERHTLTIL